MEPLPCPVEGCTARYVRGFFPQALAGGGKYDVVLHTHCMEHMQDLHAFLSAIVSHLRPGGMMVFVVPDMRRMMEYGMTSTVHFEHSIYLSDRYVEYLLGQYGFSVLEKEGYCDGHSLIYAARLTGEAAEVSLDGMYEENRALFQRYHDAHVAQMAEWSARLESDPRPCYLFGAHISSQLFAAFGLNLGRVRAILDNSPVKIGQRVMGIDKEVLPPSVLKDAGPAIVILPRTPYAEEIKEGIRESASREAEFWMME